MGGGQCWVLHLRSELQLWAAGAPSLWELWITVAQSYLPQGLSRCWLAAPEENEFPSICLLLASPQAQQCRCWKGDLGMYVRKW